MGVRQAVLQLSIAATTLAMPFSPKRESGIQWGNCSFAATVPILCATLPVPLDYNDTTSNATLDLSLIKVPVATNVTSKGSILFNFGGPGDEAVQTLASIAPQLQNMSGGQHDLVAFDPRGTGNTLLYSCFENNTDRTLFNAQYPFAVGLDDETMGKNWATAKLLGNACAKTTQDIGSLIGTAYVARDMMQVVDALGEDGLLRYWGFSYGTVLGATVAAMFPDRVERMILDGVVNTPNYYNRYGIDVDQMLSVDAAFTSAMDECIKAGDNCPLSQINSTARDLTTTLVSLAEGYKTAPLALDSMIISYDLVITLIYAGLKYPSLLSTVTPILVALLEGNTTSIEEIASAYSQELTTTGTESIYGILCSDKIPRDTDISAIKFDTDYIAQTSATFGPILSSVIPLCAQWPFEAKERYTGGFDNIKTKSPILFVGNTWDPATAYESAQTMSKGFEGSAWWEQHGFGHCTIQQTSTCTNKIMTAYFNDGTLPESGTLCEVDVGLFDASS